MNKSVFVAIVTLAVLGSTTMAQEMPFAGDVRSISVSPGEDLLTAMSRHATRLLDDPGVNNVWVGYPLRVREAFRSAYNREFGNGRYHNCTIVNDIVVEWDNDGIERVGSEIKAIIFHFTKAGGKVIQDRISFIDLGNGYRFITPLLWITDVSSERSLAAVTKILENTVSRNLQDETVSELAVREGSKLRSPRPQRRRQPEAVLIIAMHEGREPLEVMQRIILSDKNVDLREDVLFWFGLALQPSEQHMLFALEGRLNHPDLREQLAFIYSRLDTEETIRRLISMARRDPNHDVRERAIFWMGQKASARLAAELGDIIDNDPDTDIRKEAVFALSRMETPESRKALMKLARYSKNPELRKAALFWLARDEDAQVVDFLEEILVKQ